MTEWPAVALGEMTTLIKRGRAPSYSEAGVLVAGQKCVRTGNVVDLASARRTDPTLKPIPEWAYLCAGDVLVNSTGYGTLGRAAVILSVEESTTADSHVSIVRADPAKVDAVYLGNVLSAARGDLEHLQTGSTKQTELSPAALASYKVPLPPLSEQRRIVAVMTAVDAQINALEAEIATIDTIYIDALGLLWLDSDGIEGSPRRLGELMNLDIERVKVDDDCEYRIAGVLNAGQGLIAREAILGSGTDYATFNRLSAGQAVMRKLTAWEGTLAVVPPSFDGYFASNEFPTFSFRPSLSARYFAHVCRSPRLWQEMQNRVTGTVQRRKRLNPDQLLDVALPIPGLEQQEQTAGVLDAVMARQASTSGELAALRTVRADLLTALLSQEIAVDEAVDKFVTAA